MRRAPPGLTLSLCAALLGACSSTTLATSEPTRDAAADAAPDDATQPDVAADVAADVADDVAAPGPLDGAWRVTDIVCNGAPGSAAARRFITAPNSSSFEVRGGRSTYTLTTTTCTQRLESDVAYPSPGRAVFTARGPFSCAPARCAPGCGATPGLPYVYQYAMRGASLVMTTVGATPDVTCTAYGQGNPITYSYERL